MAKPENVITVSPRTIFLVLGLLTLIWLSSRLLEILVLVFISWLLASTLFPAVGWLERRNLPRGLGIAAFYLLFLFSLGGLGIAVSHLLVDQGTQLLNDLPVLINRLSLYLENLPGIRADFQLSAILADNARSLITQAQIVLFSTLAYFFKFLQGFVGLVTVLVLTFLMLIKPRHLEKSILALVPSEKRPQIQDFAHDAFAGIGNFIRGQLVVSAIIASLIGLGLALLDVPYAMVLALLAFVLNIIPIIGSLLAAVLAIVVALGQEPLLALWTGLLYLAANQLEANLIGPLVIGRTVGLSPFGVIVGLLIGGSLYGIPGVFLAVPVAVIVKLAVQRFYIQGVLGESPESEGPEVPAPRFRRFIRRSPA